MLLFHPNHQPVSLELRTGSPESKLGPARLQCALCFTSFCILWSMKAQTHPGWMDGWIFWRNSNREIVLAKSKPIPLKLNIGIKVH